MFFMPHYFGNTKKPSLWSKLPQTNPRINRRRRSLQSRIHHQAQEKRARISILREMYPISEALWEPEEVFSDDGDLLTQYKERHQL